MTKRWKSRKPMSREEALAMIDTLSAEERKELLLVQEKWPIVMEREGKMSSAAMQAITNLAMLKVSLYMRILEALSAADTAIPRDAEQTKTEAPPAIAKAAADLRSIADGLENIVQDSIAASLHDVAEQAKRASEAQANAAEATIADMAATMDDLQYANDEMASEAKELSDRLGALQKEHDHLCAQHEGAGERISALTTSKLFAEQRSEALQAENADLRAANTVLTQELEDAKQKRDAYHQERDEKHHLAAKLATDIAVVKEQRDHRAGEITELRSTLRTVREQHAREISSAREEHARQMARAERRISELETLLRQNPIRSPAA